MLTVLGLVVGYGIQYRAGNGFERYQDGRNRWNDLIKGSRTLGRLVWNGVPEDGGKLGGTEEARREKKRFLGALFVEKWAVAIRVAGGQS